MNSDSVIAAVADLVAIGYAIAYAGRGIIDWARARARRSRDDAVAAHRAPDPALVETGAKAHHDA
ncbi:hypothetical protein [Nonomuraea rubra]|uniref:hypothetical protein n=1 Tax=Nonomuraea rubra TaxID=46180 RepID=UPI003408BBFD